MLLDSIQKANDIKKIKEKDLDSLAAEIRQFLAVLAASET